MHQDRGRLASAARPVITPPPPFPERDYLVSVPAATLPAAASPQKPGNARGAPVHIHITAGAAAPGHVAQPAASAAFASRQSSTAASRTDTPAGTPVKALPAGGSGAATPPAMSPAAAQPPPSSSKRMLAPNGQPRKIPMAMDFDQGAQAFWGAVVHCL